MSFVPENQPLPPVAEAIDVPAMDHSTTPIVTYTWWEPDPDAAPIYRERVTPHALDRGATVDYVPIPGRYRRKRMEAWRDASGVPRGRWTWEYRSG